MPTYADEWNEQQRALGQSGPSNPVRLTISKGDYVWDPRTSRFSYEERWEEEHLMEDEELHDDNRLAALSSLEESRSRGSSPSLPAALQPMSLRGAFDGAFISLWVLDTNTLLSCLDLLKALFASLLTRNVAHAAALKQQHASSLPAATKPSSIKLLLPHVVISELDGLKISRHKDSSNRPVASQARDANYWLLSALQKQKRVPIDEAGGNLPEDLWPLFVQSSAHYKASKGSCGDSRWDIHDFTTPDDEIVKFAFDLQQQTHSHVRFCSDDTNARTKAEGDGIDTLGMRELARTLKSAFKDVSPGERWRCIADAIIEQWEYQVGSTGQLQQREDQHIPHEQKGAHPQTAEQASAPTPQPHLPASHYPHSPPNHAPNGSAVSGMNNELVEVDMDTEEQSLPVNRAGSFSQPEVAPASTPGRQYPTKQGRSTNDSIYSPQNARQATRATRARLPPSPSQSSAVSIQADNHGQDRGTEALNPTIEWEDLMQQLGPSSRVGKKQRNGRW